MKPEVPGSNSDTKVFVNNYTCSRVMAYVYDLCMFIRYLVSITLFLKVLKKLDNW
jgi:hypothetical protein